MMYEKNKTILYQNTDTNNIVNNTNNIVFYKQYCRQYKQYTKQCRQYKNNIVSSEKKIDNAHTIL